MKIEDIAIDHKNTVKTDNSLENLRFCTQGENCHFKIEQGVSGKGKQLLEDHKIKIGEGNRGKIVSEKTKMKMRETKGTPLVAICIENGVKIHGYGSYHMSELLGVSPKTIQRHTNSGKPLRSKINTKIYVITKTN